MKNFYNIKLLNPHNLTLNNIKTKFNEFINESAEKHNIFLPIACGIGNCTSCISKILFGKIYMPPQTILSTFLLKKNFILPCITTVLSDIVIITHQEKILY